MGAFSKIGPQLLSSPKSCSPHLCKNRGHPSSASCTETISTPGYPEPLVGAQLASFPLSWSMPPALPTWTICRLWKNASFLTLTSLFIYQSVMNWEPQEPGISGKTVPEGWSPSQETHKPTCRQRMAMSAYLLLAWQRFFTV